MGYTISSTQGRGEDLFGHKLHYKVIPPFTTRNRPLTINWMIPSQSFTAISIVIYSYEGPHVVVAIAIR